MRSPAPLLRYFTSRLSQQKTSTSSYRRRKIDFLSGLDYLKAHGYTTFEKEGIVIEGWPVQFLPATTALEREAYLNAQILDVDEIPVRVALPEHLVAIMLNVGRPKDTARIKMFLSQDAVELSALKDVLNRHGLTEKWSRLQEEFLK